MLTMPAADADEVTVAESTVVDVIVAAGEIRAQNLEGSGVVVVGPECHYSC